MIKFYLYFFSENGLSCEPFDRLKDLKNFYQGLNSSKIIFDISARYPDLNKIEKETITLVDGIYFSKAWAFSFSFANISKFSNYNGFFQIHSSPFNELNFHRARCYVYSNSKEDFNPRTLLSIEKLNELISNPQGSVTLIDVAFESLPFEKVVGDLQNLKKGIYLSKGAYFSNLLVNQKFDHESELRVGDLIVYRLIDPHINIQKINPYKIEIQPVIEDKNSKAENSIKTNFEVEDLLLEMAGPWGLHTKYFFNLNKIYYLSELCDFNLDEYQKPNFQISNIYKEINSFLESKKITKTPSISIIKKEIKNIILSDNFDFSVRLNNIFQNEKIITLADLIKLSEADLMMFRSFGRNSLKEINNFLKIHYGALVDKTAHLKVIEDETLTSANILISRMKSLSINTKKLLSSANIVYLSDLNNWSETQLLEIKGLGRSSLDEILKVKPSLPSYSISVKEIPDLILLESFSWSIRTQNIFEVEKIIFLSDLIKYSAQQLLKIPNFGKKSLDEVNVFLEQNTTYLEDKSIKFIDSSILEEQNKTKTQDKADLYESIFAFIEEAINNLSGRNYQVMNGRYHQGKTLEEVGQALGVTRERIRQIQKKEIRKILLGTKKIILVWETRLESQFIDRTYPISLDYVSNLKGFSGASSSETQLKFIFDYFFEKRLYVITFDGFRYLSRISQDDFLYYYRSLEASISEKKGMKIPDVENYCRQETPYLAKDFFQYLFQKILTDSVVTETDNDGNEILKSFFHQRGYRYAIDDIFTNHVKHEISNQELKKLLKKHYPYIKFRNFSNGLQSRNDLFPFSHGTWGTFKILNIENEISEKIKESIIKLINQSAEEQFHSKTIFDNLESSLKNNLNEFKVSGLIKHFNLAYYLGRNVFAKLSSEKSKRLKLLDIGIAVLEQNGSPMYVNDFESNLRKKRNFSASTQYVYQKPIIKLKNKMVALDYWDNSNPVLNGKKNVYQSKKVISENTPEIKKSINQTSHFQDRIVEGQPNEIKKSVNQTSYFQDRKTADQPNEIVFLNENSLVPKWDEYRTSQLIMLAKRGLSASKIAKKLGGTTRNAVIGKLTRLRASGKDV